MQNNYKKEVEDLLAINKELVQKNDNLEQQNKELKQFSYLASHDLQQPVNNIISYLSILEDSKDKLDDLGNLCLDAVKKSSYKMKSFITSLLEYTIIGSNPKNEEFYINDVINSVKDVLLDKIDKANAEINISIKEHQLKGYKNDIQLLFLHIIENALIYSKKNSKLIINIKSEVKENNYLYSISDNGIGIDKVHFKKIYDIFYTINRDEEFDGIGIGLAECKKIIKLYGGKIWVASELDKGTTFFFTLPRQ
ncbi:GHKL domain-containing protein [Polaribacter vadi]|uniref:sensor histidine kinase n=1 Tax=Polaribacter TaxID=52959 RepID=UPI001C09D78E|nr:MULTISPECIES: ATP-binding protein [Polaribacter]MBU3010119.1 GHKL domain-containing protein [Polaribacter vadi]MDO6739926.1 ATP-binding protein [Polaribacter sp. 1_MG-2023]